MFSLAAVVGVISVLAFSFLLASVLRELGLENAGLVILGFFAIGALLAMISILLY
ncbi:MAG: hypothetical protein AAFR21_13745 [Pseudomonadota bacterium]